LSAQRLSGDPHAEFVVLQASLEIGHQSIKQILSGLVELAEVGPPGDLADDVYTCFD